VDDFYVNLTAWLYQLIIGMMTTVLIYHVGIKMLENQFFPNSNKIDFRMKYRIE